MARSLKERTGGQDRGTIRAAAAADPMTQEEEGNRSMSWLFPVCYTCLTERLNRLEVCGRWRGGGGGGEEGEVGGGEGACILAMATCHPLTKSP